MDVAEHFSSMRKTREVSASEGVFPVEVQAFIVQQHKNLYDCLRKKELLHLYYTYEEH